MLAFALGQPGAALARFDDSDATHACKQQARSQYSATGFHSVTAAKIARDDFKVTGVMSRRGSEDANFTCRYTRGAVAALSVGDSEGTNTGAVVGAVVGLAAAAILIGALSDDHKHDDHQGDGSRPNGDGQWGQSYSPRPGFTCYSRQRACYRPNGDFAPKMTNLEFGTGGSSSPRPNPGIAVRDMPRYCQGEASAKFSVNPRDINIGSAADRDGANYLVYGRFVDRRNNSRLFTCTFNASRRFVSVVRG